jgi:transcriptional regulator with XRE-family HTH domain
MLKRSPKSTYTEEHDALRTRLAELRVAAGLTQRQLAKSLKRVTHTYVVKAERGDRRIDAVELFWICKACGVHPEKEFAAIARMFETIEEARRKAHR